jgi:hypothetical protein
MQDPPYLHRAIEKLTIPVFWGTVIVLIRFLENFQTIKSPQMPLEIKDLHKVDETSASYIVEENVTVELKSCDELIRCNVYRPKDVGGRYPVLVTYGPYGKDIHYKE